jgi:hypothetical protein
MKPEHRMSQQFSQAQSNALRTAIDMVIATLSADGETKRAEIGRIALSIASRGDFSAAAIAKMTLAELDERERKTG